MGNLRLCRILIFPAILAAAVSGCASTPPAPPAARGVSVNNAPEVVLIAAKVEPGLDQIPAKSRLRIGKDSHFAVRSKIARFPGNGKSDCALALLEDPPKERTVEAKTWWIADVQDSWDSSENAFFTYIYLNGDSTVYRVECRDKTQSLNSLSRLQEVLKDAELELVFPEIRPDTSPGKAP